MTTKVGYDSDAVPVFTSISECIVDAALDMVWDEGLAWDEVTDRLADQPMWMFVGRPIDPEWADNHARTLTDNLLEDLEEHVRYPLSLTAYQNFLTDITRAIQNAMAENNCVIWEARATYTPSRDEIHRILLAAFPDGRLPDRKLWAKTTSG